MLSSRERFQFTHPARGATPLVGRVTLSPCFNSRTPRGVRPRSSDTRARAIRFQFTHPARGATKKERKPATDNNGFNSRTPRGVRLPLALMQCRTSTRFNSRTPRGVRHERAVDKGFWDEFQFTHPARGATLQRYKKGQGIGVSIHAPREGCDDSLGDLADGVKSFNSRTPRGVRRGGLYHTC